MPKFPTDDWKFPGVPKTGIKHEPMKWWHWVVYTSHSVRAWRLLKVGDTKERAFKWYKGKEDAKANWEELLKAMQAD